MIFLNKYINCSFSSDKQDRNSKLYSTGGIRILKETSGLQQTSVHFISNNINENILMKNTIYLHLSHFGQAVM